MEIKILFLSILCAISVCSCSQKPTESDIENQIRNMFGHCAPLQINNLYKIRSWEPQHNTYETKFSASYHYKGVSNPKDYNNQLLKEWEEVIVSANTHDKKLIELNTRKEELIRIIRNTPQKKIEVYEKYFHNPSAVDQKWASLEHQKREAENELRNFDKNYETLAPLKNQYVLQWAFFNNKPKIKFSDLCAERIDKILYKKIIEQADKLHTIYMENPQNRISPYVYGFSNTIEFNFTYIKTDDGWMQDKLELLEKVQ